MPFVLVHGGGFSGGCWDEIRPLLSGSSYAVDLPGRGERPADLSRVSLSDFAAAVVEVIVGNDLDDVTLVGHSMAGLTLPRVADLVPRRLASLVFVSCAVPPHGVPMSDVLIELSPTVASVADRIGDAAVDERGVLQRDLAVTMFCNDMDAEQTAKTLEQLVPEAQTVLDEPCDLNGLRHLIPRAYVRLTCDSSITPDQQDRMIERLGDVDVIDLEAGHMAMISNPHGLAAILNDLASVR